MIRMPRKSSCLEKKPAWRLDPGDRQLISANGDAAGQENNSKTIETCCRSMANLRLEALAARTSGRVRRGDRANHFGLLNAYCHAGLL